MRPANIEDLRQTARRRMPRMFFDYLDGGSFSEQTLRRNRDALERVLLRPRGLRDASTIDTGCSLFGDSWSMPLGLGPLGFAGMFHAAGESAAARAARQAGLPFCLSTFSVQPLSKLAGAGFAPWLQLYLFKDPAIGEGLIEAAKRHNLSTLVLTIDTAVSGIRERDTRNGFRTASRLSLRQMADMALRPRWLVGRGLAGAPELGTLAGLELPGAPKGVMAQAARFSADLDPAITRDKLEALRKAWPGRLVVKGVMGPEEATMAAEAGADAVIVSNHGGRQLDGAPASIEALPAVAAAVKGGPAVLLDSGIRRGTDVLRALALGADFVLIGRAWAYGLAAGGEAGVTAAIELIRAELRITMGLTGVTDIAMLKEAGREIIDRMEER